ncbi:MAG TPA: response regulator [Candidatus Marinimicrobia bacterium]|nr:response regulator [Candidatus Neomarinimicrobiota bacterium]
MLIDKDILKKTYFLSLQKRMTTLSELINNHRDGDSDAAESILRIAHTLTGSGATFGFPIISEKARALEIATPESFQELYDDLQNYLTQLLEEGAVPHRSILIIEDDLVTQKMIANALKGEFQEIDLADTGSLAKNKIAQKIYSAVLLDLMLPDMDGREVLIRLRENYSTFHTPVIVLSSITEPKHIKECYMLGANGYMTKPFSRELLISTLQAKIRQAHNMAANEIVPANQGIGVDHSMMEKAKDYFVKNPGKRPWIVMINLFQGEDRIEDDRISQLGDLAGNQLSEIKHIALRVI